MFPIIKFQKQLPSFPALKHKNYRLFFIGQGISLIGTWMQTIATSWLVYRLTGSTALLGVTGFSSQILTFFLSPFSGVWIEDHNKKQILFIAQLLSLIQATVLALLVLTNQAEVWHIIAMNLLLGAINAFDMPTRHALVLELVDNDKNDLHSAIAMNSSLFNGARVLGPMLAGVTISVAGEGICFVVNALSYVFILFALLKIHTNFIKLPKDPLPIFQRFLVGCQYVWKVKETLYAMISLFVMSLFGMGYIILLPVFASEVFHGNSKEYGLLSTASGIGALIGAIMIALQERPTFLKIKITFAALFYYIGLMFFSQTTSLTVAYAILFLIGLAGVIQISSINTLIQLELPIHLRGRVMSLYTMVFVGAAPIGSILTGFLAEHVGPRQSVLYCQIMAFVLTLSLLCISICTRNTGTRT